MGGFLCNFDDFREKQKNNFEKLHREEISDAKPNDMLHKSVRAHGAFHGPRRSKTHTQNLDQRARAYAKCIQKPKYPQVFPPVLIYPKQHQKTHA